MKRSIQLLLTIIVLPALVIGQSKAYKKDQKRVWSEANYFYELEDYKMALKLYSDIYLFDEDYSEINFRIGVCYFNIQGEKKNSTIYFEKAKLAGNTEAYFWLGKAYHIEEKFSLAKKNYQIYKRKTEKLVVENEVERHIDISRRAESALQHPKFVRIENLGSSVNTKYQETLPFVTADESKLVFASQRPESSQTEISGNSDLNNVIYTANKDGDNWMNVQKFGLEDVDNMNDVVVGMNDNGNIILINRTKRGMNYGDLYLCEYKNNKWNSPVLLSASINSEHKESSACITAEGNLIYFTSNRPGGLGGKDIWKVKKLPTEEWAKPVNVGGPINSPYDEEAPFISPDGKTLYFSSNGHSTMGGYDIFEAESRGDGSWKKPENMGFPINTVDDDIYFTVGENDQTAYYSSFRDDSYGGSDIYQVSLLYKEDYMTPVKLVVKDPKTKKPLNAIITLYFTETGEVYGDYLPNEKGEFLLTVKPDVQFDMEISAEGFETGIHEFSLDVNEALGSLVTKEVQMQ